MKGVCSEHDFRSWLNTSGQTSPHLLWHTKKRAKKYYPAAVHHSVAENHGSKASKLRMAGSDFFYAENKLTYSRTQLKTYLHLYFFPEKSSFLGEQTKYTFPQGLIPSLSKLTDGGMSKTFSATTFHGVSTSKRTSIHTSTASKLPITTRDSAKTF